MAPEDTTWILAGDASRARLFTSTDGGKTLNLVQEFAHPASRLKDHDLVSDRPGRMQQSGQAGRGGNGNGGSRSGYDSATDPKEVEVELFAKELCDTLNRGLGSNNHAHLVLVAPPHFLGLLRAGLTDSVHKRVVGSIHKEYTQISPQELSAHLLEQLPSVL